MRVVVSSRYVLLQVCTQTVHFIVDCRAVCGGEQVAVVLARCGFARVEGPGGVLPLGARSCLFFLIRQFRPAKTAAVGEARVGDSAPDVPGVFELCRDMALPSTFEHRDRRGSRGRCRGP